MAYELMKDLHGRVIEGRRFQMTTDGLPWYAQAIDRFFGIDVDYGIIQKHYTAEPTGRYSPPRFVSATQEVVLGDPDPLHISTSFIERQNLTLRMSMRRFTRLTNAFSKKVENHVHAVALHFMYYNFGRIHRTLRVTPAMAAGLSDHVWSVEEIVCLLDRPATLAA